MTGREVLTFLQSLSEEAIELDVEVKIEGVDDYVWIKGIAQDCNGIYLCDDYKADEMYEDINTEHMFADWMRKE